MRAWPVSSWRHGDRVAATRRALDALAEMAATARGTTIPAVPDLRIHALADQLVVLVGDAGAAGVPADQVNALLAALRTDLGLG